MILHIDMDAFYASVEERDRPELRGKPVIVGGLAENRGVVSAANYRAREFGVHSAMPAGRAKRLCPQAIVLPPDLRKYAEVSQKIREIFERFTPLIEPLSLDEAFLDVTGSERLFGPAESIGRAIQSAIKDELRLNSSVGVAPNKFLAKLASDLEKPLGFVVVEENEIQNFLDPLSVTRLWGVGKVAAQNFKKLGIETVAQLRNCQVKRLEELFGKSGRKLWNLARGIDNRKVVPDHEAKSISHETTFALDVEDWEVLRSWLMSLTDQVARRLRRNRLKGKTVQLKIRYGDFTTVTRAESLAEPTCSTDDIWNVAEDLLLNKLPNRPLQIRLIGIGMTGLQGERTQQRSLFDDENQEKQNRLDHVADAIVNRFGKEGLSRGIEIQRDQ